MPGTNPNPDPAQVLRLLVSLVLLTLAATMAIARLYLASDSNPGAGELDGLLLATLLPATAGSILTLTLPVRLRSSALAAAAAVVILLIV